MEHIEMQLIAECMQDAFAQSKTFSFTPYGDSMLPTIQNGKHFVTFTQCINPKVYDIVLYRRPSGMYVLHRIVGKLRDGFMLCGDNENTIEYPIYQKDMIAKVIAIRDENGKSISLHCKGLVKKLWLKKVKLFIKKILCS